ncbi:hypothetical protein D3C81_882300 [compost metagenome]
MREAAREALLQLSDLFLRRTGIIPVKITVNRFAVFAHHVSDVLRTFHPAFDFKRRHPRLNQLRHDVDRRQILRRQQVGYIAHRLLFPVDHQVVRQATSLCTFAAVRRAPAPHLRRQTLTRIGHAQRPMHKYLHRQLGLLPDHLDLLEVIFPPQHHAFHIPRLHELHRFRRGDRHLRRAMNRKIRRQFTNQLH